MGYIGGLLLPTNIGLENPHFEWLKFLQMSRIGRPALGVPHWAQHTPPCCSCFWPDGRCTEDGFFSMHSKLPERVRYKVVVSRSESLSWCVYNSNFTMVYRWYIELVNGDSKPTYNQGSPPCIYRVLWLEGRIWGTSAVQLYLDLSSGSICDPVLFYSHCYYIFKLTFILGYPAKRIIRLYQTVWLDIKYS